MGIGKEQLDECFIESSVSFSGGERGHVVDMERVRAAKFLIKLRKLSKLCGLFDGYVDTPTKRTGARSRFEADKKNSKNIFRVLVGLKIYEFIELNNSYPNHRFCPYVETLLSSMEEYHFFTVLKHWDKFRCLDSEYISLLTEMVRSVQERITSKNFRSEIYNHERSARKNSKEAWKYVCRLFNEHAKMLVMRVDFHYLKEFSLGGDEVSFEDMILHRTKLLRSMRFRKEFEHILGMIWKVEYAPTKGYHLHALFFFDGNKRKEIYPIHNGLFSFWADEVTEGKGYVYTVDPKKHVFKYPFVGIVEYHEREKLKGIKYAVHYLSKADFLARLNAPGRTFGRMVIKPSGSRKGRPRHHGSIIDTI